MKQITNLTLLIYGKTFGLINLDRIKNPWLKLIPALCMFPFLFAFIIIALGIEEPIKCLFAVIFTKNSSQEVWLYYKKCWKSLIGGMRYDN